MLHTPMIIYDKILFLINNVNSTFQVYDYVTEKLVLLAMHSLHARHPPTHLSSSYRTLFSKR